MTTWTAIGLNLLEEPMEENPLGQRRVRTSAGLIQEPTGTHLRFGRLATSEHAQLLARALAWPRMLASYGNSFARAAAVWMTPPGQPVRSAPESQVKGLVQAASRAASSRCWGAFLSGFSPHDLPAWNAAIERPGGFSWPLGIDLALAKEFGLTQDFEGFLTWSRSQQSSGRLLVSPASPAPPRPGALRVLVASGAWDVWHVDRTWSGSVTLLRFAPPAPPAQDLRANATYLPFSSSSPRPSGHVDPLLARAQAQARPPLAPLEIQSQMAQALGITQAELQDRLSEEQMDAVWLSWKALESGRSFLLADETGYGKGRVLAALSRIAMNQGAQVMFVTERKALLSDFWRDAAVLFAGQVPPPVIAHADARVLSPDGSALAPQPPRRLPAVGDAWVWTTYSQFNRKNPTRMSAFQGWIKSRPTWLLLDEAHNAASESATAANLDVFQKAAAGVMYSSATFAKTEVQLHGYRRLFEGSRDEWFKMMSAFDFDSDTLRAAITLSWAERGAYLRREHPPIPLPDAVWLPVSDQRKKDMAAFSAVWRAMYDCAQAFSRQYPQAPAPWLVLGGPLSRALREYAILDKVQDVVAQISRAVSEGKKPVVVSDWTLSSHVARWVAGTSEVPDQDAAQEDEGFGLSSPDRDLSSPLWRESWKGFVLDTFTNEDIASSSQPVELEAARQAVLQALDALPAWTVSPFDAVHEAACAAGIRLGEVSGRSWRLVHEKDRFHVMSRPDDRQAQVASFNAGNLDAILLTRAGNSGISLHAARQFADRRQRVLIEWDVAPDPSVRVQFWGRVRRRDQESEPERLTLMLDTPAERRKYHREAEKQRRLVAHGGSSEKTGTAWAGPAADYLAGLWCQDQPSAFLLGRSPTATQVFSRSIVLSNTLQERLVFQMDRGLSLMEDWLAASTRTWSEESRLVRSAWWWGAGSSQLSWQERVFSPRPGPGASAVQSRLSASMPTAVDVETAWQQVEAAWKDQPRQASPERRRWRTFWQQHHAQFERGMAIEAKDPSTGERVRGVVLGFSLPTRDFDASQVGMEVWLSTQPSPLWLPLPAWFDTAWGGARPLSARAQPAWFDQAAWPVSVRLLMGPPGLVAAWGIRQKTKGELVRLEDNGGVAWGWRMPASWSWEQAMASDRELANTLHAAEYLRQRVVHPLSWRWASQCSIHMTPQGGGLVVSGSEEDWNCLSFPVRRQLSRPTWSGNTFQATLSWKRVRPVVESLAASGAVPMVPASQAEWCRLSWPKPKKS